MLAGVRFGRPQGNDSIEWFLTVEAHIFMWQVRMGRSQDETGQPRFPQPSGWGYRAEGNHGNSYSVVLNLGCYYS